MERWKTIKGFQGSYKVSNYGHVKSFKRNKDGILLKVKCKQNREYVVLKDRNHPSQKYYIYILMRQYFPGEHYQDFKSKF